MKICISLFVLLSIGILSCKDDKPKENKSQLTVEQRKVQQVILDLFKGMKLGDSSIVHNCFRDDVKLFTIFSRNDSTIFKNDGGLQNFLNAVGTPHNIVWNELSWNYKIKIDGPLAQAWCDYAFYAGNELSHCGVDAFELVKVQDKWKIFSLADTRRKENCDLPPEEQIFRP